MSMRSGFYSNQTCVILNIGYVAVQLFTTRYNLNFDLFTIFSSEGERSLQNVSDLKQTSLTSNRWHYITNIHVYMSPECEYDNVC